MDKARSEMRDSPNALATDLWTPTASRDCSLRARALRAAETHRRTALRFTRDGARHELRYSEFGPAVREIAAGLIALGIEPGHSVAVLS
jgi:long-subunit acyl-CoA synthetase (AMP-forming)